MTYEPERAPPHQIGTALLARIAKSDRAAMEDFYRGYQASVYRFALAKLSEPFAAADVLNETMLQVWLHARRYAGYTNPLTWLLGIAHHKAMDWLRARYRHASDPLDESIPDTDRPDISDTVGAFQDRERVRDCMQGLSEKHRAAIHLAFFEDMGYAQIAESLQCPEGTVKTRVFHAKELLRRCLTGVRA